MGKLGKEIATQKNTLPNLHQDEYKPMSEADTRRKADEALQFPKAIRNASLSAYSVMTFEVIYGKKS